MANAIITLQLGQCGNQVGFEFWKSLCTDHGVSPNGDLLELPYDLTQEDNREVFFYKADDERYVARSVLVDLEPRVVNSIMNSNYSNLFTKENIFLSPEGGGAGNNWANGYVQGKKYEEEIFDILDRVAEDSESVGGFMVCHSMAGGTGSGVGSYILESLADRFPKKTVQTFSVFPHQEEMGDVVVQAYNSLFMLERLITYADSVIVLDNAAFQRILEVHLKEKAPTYMEINQLITKVMNMFTNPMRLPTYQYNTLSSLTSPLAPTASMHFLTASFTPWNVSVMKKRTLPSTMRDLLKSKNMIISTKNKSSLQHGYLAILDIIQGKFDPEKLFDAIGYIRENHFAQFVPWVPDSLQVLLANFAPGLSDLTSVSGLMLANHTGISPFFERMIQNFDRLRQRNAFLGQYQSQGVFSENFEEMDISRDIADCLVQEYEAASKSEFLRWTPKRRNASEMVAPLLNALKQ